MEDRDINMIDVGQKDDTEREAVASGSITMTEDTLGKVLSGTLVKGNVIAAAKTAGIMAAKKTSNLLPLCHPLPVTNVDVDIESMRNGLRVKVRVNYQGKTGVEMEALTGCSIALLTIYDMVKNEEQDMTIEDVKLLKKSGGKSGDWERK